MANINFNKHKGETLRHDEWNALGDEISRLENKIESSKGTKINFPNDSKKFLNGEGEFSVPTLKTINVEAVVEVVKDNEDAKVIKGETDSEITLKFSLPKGDKGDTGNAYIPSVDENGILTFTKTPNDELPSETPSYNIKGDRGTGLTASSNKNGKTTKVTISKDDTSEETIETFDIVDGDDAINPFKGWFNSLGALNAVLASPSIGDYAYITISGTTYIQRCTTTGSWGESVNSEKFNPSNPTLASGENLSDVHLKEYPVILGSTAEKGVLSAAAAMPLFENVLKEDFEKEYAGVLGNCVRYEGLINGSTWKYQNNSEGQLYSYVVLPLSGKSRVEITANSEQKSNIVFLSDFHGHDAGNAPQVAGGQNTVIEIAAGESETLISPKGTKFLYVYMTNSAGANMAPASLKITGEKWLEENEKEFVFEDSKVSQGGKCICPPAANETSYLDEWRSYLNDASKYYYKITTSAESNQGGVLRVKSNASYPANISIAKEKDGTANTGVNFAKGYRKTVVIGTDVEVDLIIPSDAVYIQIWFGGGTNYAYKPAKVSFVQYEIAKTEDEKFEDVDNKVAEVEEEVYVKKVEFTGVSPMVFTNTGHLAKDTTNGYYRHMPTNDSNIWFNKLDSLGCSVGDIVEITAKQSYPAYLLFIASGGGNYANSWTSGSAIVLADNAPHTIDYGKTEKFVIPEGTTKIWVTCTTALGYDAKPEVFIIKRNLKKEIEGNKNLTVFTIQERVARRKADLFTNMKWTPKVATIPYHGAGDYFYAVQEYKGLPYSSNLDHGKWLGTHVSLYTFLTAVNNKYSLLYTESLKSSPRQHSAWEYDYNESGNGSSYYGTVCCALTGFVTGAYVVWNNPDFYDHIDNFELIQTHKQDGYEFDLNKLKVGDILDNTGHSFVIYELKYDANGFIIGYVAKEATNYNSAIDGNTVKGAWTRPQINFPDDLEKFDHFRYKGMEFNTHINDIDAGVYDKDGEISVEYNNDICTIAGDKCTFTNYNAEGYRNSNVIALNYNLNDDANFASTYDTIVVKKVASNTTPVSYMIANIDNSEYDSSEQGHALKLGDLESGKYEAWLTGDNGNVESGKTTFIVVGADDFTAVKSAEGIRVTANNKSYKITYIAAYLPASGQESDYINVGDIKGNVSPLRIEHEWELENLSGSDRKVATNKNHSLLLAASKIDGYMVDNNYVLYVDIMTEFGIQRIKGIVPAPANE